MKNFKIFTVMLVASLALLSFNTYAQDDESPGSKYGYCIDHSINTLDINWLDGATMQFAMIGNPGLFLIHGKEQATSYTAYQSKVENKVKQAEDEDMCYLYSWPLKYPA